MDAKRGDPDLSYGPEALTGPITFSSMVVCVDIAASLSGTTSKKLCEVCPSLGQLADRKCLTPVGSPGLSLQVTKFETAPDLIGIHPLDSSPALMPHPSSLCSPPSMQRAQNQVLVRVCDRTTDSHQSWQGQNMLSFRGAGETRFSLPLSRYDG